MNLQFNINTNVNSVIKSKLIGGATANIFTNEELSLYNNINTLNINFKFIVYTTYELANKLTASNSMFVIYNLPLYILTSKLTINELKQIAKHHNLKVQSKSKSQDIQTIINNHICNNCTNFVSVFEIIDEVKKIKELQKKNIIAVQKYRIKNQEKSKESNLNATKKYQNNYIEKYKASNLKSVKNYQSNNSE